MVLNHFDKVSEPISKRRQCNGAKLWKASSRIKGHPTFSCSNMLGAFGRLLTENASDPGMKKLKRRLINCGTKD